MKPIGKCPCIAFPAVGLTAMGASFEVICFCVTGNICERCPSWSESQTWVSLGMGSSEYKHLVYLLTWYWGNSSIGVPRILGLSGLISRHDQKERPYSQRLARLGISLEVLPFSNPTEKSNYNDFTELTPLCNSTAPCCSGSWITNRQPKLGSLHHDIDEPSC